MTVLPEESLNVLTGDRLCRTGKSLTMQLPNLPGEKGSKKLRASASGKMAKFFITRIGPLLEDLDPLPFAVDIFKRDLDYHQV